MKPKRLSQKVKRGVHENARGATREALPQSFRQTQLLNLDDDSPDLAALIREGRKSAHVPHRKSDVRRLLDEFRQQTPK